MLGQKPFENPFIKYSTKALSVCLINSSRRRLMLIGVLDLRTSLLWSSHLAFFSSFSPDFCVDVEGWLPFVHLLTG